jgi:hypothetical protein
MPHRFFRVGAVAVIMLLGASCATEVVSETEPVDTGASTMSAMTTTLPGTPEVLLARLVVTLQAVSEAIIDSGDQRALLAQAEDMWAAAKPEVAANDAVAAEQMEGMMDLARTAVDRTRPADADKAAKFLGDLVENYVDD